VWYWRTAIVIADWNLECTLESSDVDATLRKSLPGAPERGALQARGRAAEEMNWPPLVVPAAAPIRVFKNLRVRGDCHQDGCQGVRQRDYFEGCDLLPPRAGNGPIKFKFKDRIDL
jgi:hypothetical protein